MCIYHGIRIVQLYKSSCVYYIIRLAMGWGMDETLDHRQSDQSSLTLFSGQVIGCTTCRATPSRKRLRIFGVNRRRLLHAKNANKVRHRQPAYGEEWGGQVDDGMNTPYTEWADFGQQPRTTLFPLSLLHGYPSPNHYALPSAPPLPAYIIRRTLQKRIAKKIVLIKTNDNSATYNVRLLAVSTSLLLFTVGRRHCVRRIIILTICVIKIVKNIVFFFF